jgi:hypothetical protein
MTACCACCLFQDFGLTSMLFVFLLLLLLHLGLFATLLGEAQLAPRVQLVDAFCFEQFQRLVLLWSGRVGELLFVNCYCFGLWVELESL